MHGLVETKEEKQAGEFSMSKVERELAELEITYQGNVQEGTVYLGQIIGLIDRMETVQEIIDSMICDAEKSLTNAFNTIKPSYIEQAIEL